MNPYWGFQLVCCQEAVVLHPPAWCGGLPRLEVECHMCPAGAVWVWNSTHQSASVKKRHVHGPTLFIVILLTINEHKFGNYNSTIVHRKVWNRSYYKLKQFVFWVTCLQSMCPWHHWTFIKAHNTVQHSKCRKEMNASTSTLLAVISLLTVSLLNTETHGESKDSILS